MLSASLRRGALIDAIIPVDVPAAPAVPARGRVPGAIVLAAALALVAGSLWLDAALLMRGTLTIAGVPIVAHEPVVVLAQLLGATLLIGAVSWRAEGGTTRAALLTLAGLALIVAGARVVFYLPGDPVPVTGQTFAVLLTAAALGWRRGLAAATTYAVLGAAGMPVFAVSGSPVTYGYIAGFAVAAAIVGWLAERGLDQRIWSAMLAMLAGEAGIYACGLAWLAHFTGWHAAIALGFVPFIAGDAVKIIAAALLLPVAWMAAGRVRTAEAC